MPSRPRSRASGSAAYGVEHMAEPWKPGPPGGRGRPQASQSAKLRGKSSNKPDGSAETMTELPRTFAMEEPDLEAQLLFHDYVTALKQVIKRGVTLRDFIRDNPDIRLSVSPSVIESINLVANTIISKEVVLPDEFEAERPKSGLDRLREGLGLKPQPPRQKLRRI
jgi:hypothetical protein